MRQVVAELTQLARKASEINQRSGVSVRVSICNYENLASNALKRAIRLGEREAAPRVSDLGALVASTSGKIELETLGETSEDKVLGKLMQRAVLNVFNRRFKTAELEEVVKGFEGGAAHRRLRQHARGGLRPTARSGEGARGGGVSPGRRRGARHHRLRGGVRPGRTPSEPQAQQGRPVGRSVSLPRLIRRSEESGGMTDFICGIDTGGTFTDCVVIDAGGRIVTAKAPSTPRDFSQGVLDALDLVAGKLGLTTEALLRRTARLALGTTVGTNALLQRRGARVGLITTRGHRDVIHIMRGARGVPGLASEKVLHFPESNKPDPPIVPKTLIAEVSERVDCKGEVVVELNEEEAEAAIRRLAAKGVEAIAICFLWSFKHPEHERRVKAMVERLAPGVFVCCSVDLVPRWGEYERTAATVINAYLGPVTAAYMDRVGRRVQAAGLATPVQVMQCGGGVVPAAQAARKAFLTLDSGPVAGVLASQYLGQILGQKHVIATDMGGTSFDVGLVYDGAPVASYQSVVNQYEYFVPRIDIRSIGSGGGSIIWLDETSGTLRVGPVSAGRRARAGLLRPRRDPAHGDRRRPGPRLPRSRQLPGRPPAARSARRRWPASRPSPRRLGLGVVETASGAAGWSSTRWPTSSAR